MKLTVTVPLIVLLTTSLALPTVPAAADWPQWGGPGRDFVSPGEPFGASWDEGLERLWERGLGEGYSSIAVVGSRLYTQYREGDVEVVVALDTADGKTVWEHRYAAEAPEKMRLGYGAGPHATPTVDKGLVFTVGVTGLFHALDAADGRVVWRRDLIGDLGGTLLLRGYAASPLVDGDRVLVKLGGEGQALVALNRENGEVVWRTKETAKNSPSSPILIDVDGERQMIAFMTDEVLAVSPRDGRLLWRHPHASSAAYNNGTPLWIPNEGAAGGRLLISSAYAGGSRMLHVSGGKRVAGGEKETQVTELWHSRRLKVQLTNAVLVDGVVIGSSGATGATILTAIDAADGEPVWKSRELARSSFIRRGDQFLALEQEGRLALVRLSREGLEILAETQLMEGRSWSVPALIDKMLYVRNRERILAVRLP